jgi:hypothetical protein
MLKGTNLESSSLGSWIFFISMVYHLKDQGGDQREGVNGSLIKYFHKKQAYVPHSKPLKKVIKNTNQQETNDPHKVTKPAEEEWDQTGTQLAKYDQNNEQTSG